LNILYQGIAFRNGYDGYLSTFLYKYNLTKIDIRKADHAFSMEYGLPEQAGFDNGICGGFF